PKLSATLARVRRGAHLGALVDGAYDDRFASELMRLMQEGRELSVSGGVLRFHGNEKLSGMSFEEPPSALMGEQSNVSVAFDRQALMKIFRRMRPGDQPEVEVARFLTEVAGFANTPAFLGMAELEKEGERTVLASVSAFVENQGDAWSVFVHALERHIEDEAMAPPATTDEEAEAAVGCPLDLLYRLGQRTAD